MKLVRYSAVFLSVFVLWLATGPLGTGFNTTVSGQPATVTDQPEAVSSQPATATAPSSTLPSALRLIPEGSEESFEQVRAEAFKFLSAGDFAEGTALLKSAGALRSDDSIAVARTLMADYMKVRARSDAEQQAELSVAVRRVRLARLAEKYRPELVEAKLADKLWERIKAIAEAVAAADEFLVVNSTSQPADVRKDVFKHLDRSGEELTSACALVTGRQGPWPDAFMASAKDMADAVADYRKAWLSDGQDGKISSQWRVLKAASERVHDVLIDMGVLSSGEPLIAALNHARVAKELSGDAEAFGRQEWVRELISDADRYGMELVGEGKWLDALMIYGRDGLSGIDEDNIVFKDMLKKANQHVRVQNIYGLNEASASGSSPTTGKTTSAPATKPGAEEPIWRKMIAGIDTAMVRTAIEQIDRDYVKKPDCRQVGLAGLGAVRVLVETPQAAETLEALKDEQKRLVFLEGVDRQIKHLKEIKDTVDYLHVIEALNGVLDLNSETLGLPAEVVNMEFAEGMMEAMDQFTSMIWPYQEEEFSKRTLGSFFGIGIQIRKEPGGFIEAVTPLANSPALRAGIRAGDYIVRVGGADTRMMSLEQAVKLITGPKGTSVTLTIRRAGKSDPFPVSVTRDTIRIQTVMGWQRLPGGKWDFFLDPDERIGYIRLTQFTMDTAVELRRVLQNLGQAEPPIRGLIVDMRFNPGGLLSAAEEVSDDFLSHGLIVRIKGRTNQSQKTATAIGAYQRGEVIVLVNQYSASASEIVAGALKDWGRARIVGERTYGKGSVQRPMPLKSKRAKLKLTTAYYYLPSGRCLHRTNGDRTWGVDPDVSVKTTVHQVNRWTEIRQETDLLKSIDAERLGDLLSEQLTEDIQLQTALLLMRLKLLAESQPVRQAKAA